MIFRKHRQLAESQKALAGEIKISHQWSDVLGLQAFSLTTYCSAFQFWIAFFVHVGSTISTNTSRETLKEISGLGSG